MWYSLERSPTEALAARPFSRALRSLKAVGENDTQWATLDLEYGRGIAWWGRGQGAPRILERHQDGEIYPVYKGFQAAGLDLNKWRTRQASTN